MEFSADLNGFDEDFIEPCRTCGIYFTMGLDMDQAIVKPIFGLNDAVGTMAEILEQLSAWNIQVVREDGRPQYMCIACIAEFRRLLKFKHSCVETQEQFSELEYQREHNGIVIKREIEPQEEKFCGFIYLDTDEEEISDEDGSRRVCAAFDIPHVPIKEEHMARVPVQSGDHFQPPDPKELVSQPVESSFDMIDNDSLTANMFAPSSEDASGTADDGDTEEEEDEPIIRFTYDDEAEGVAPPPPPILSPVISCKLCLYESPNQDAHLDHMRRTHLLKDWECHICSKQFTNAQESRIKFHIKYHKLQRHIKCPVCGFICSSKETLKEHKQAVHSRTKCTYCDKTIKNSILQGHLKKHLREGEIQLAQKLKLLEQLPLDNFLPEAFPSPLASSSFDPVTTDAPEPSSVSVPCAPTASNVPEDSNFPKDSTFQEDITTFKDSTAAKEPALPKALSSAKDSSNPTDTLYKMDATAPVDLPVSSLPSPCVIQCAFCSDIFEEAQQLQDHVLATHKSTRKRLRSPEDTSPRRVSSPKCQPPPTPMETDQLVPEKSTVDEDRTDQQKSRTEVSPNGCSKSSTNEQVPKKSYIACNICGRTFDLKIKLNRHLKQHKT
ncbi:zinc finger protein 236 [Drosophila rhopaloa]|uniref:Zinc finger protein 236 n=1 Tax=Drosophila rhopaloa TaxID=1041015 RepID=A0ABM5HKS0_DRORH|nr:zinc finger protein 236 [Drosophila rhopaloa]